MIDWIQAHGWEALLIFWVYSAAVSAMRSPSATQTGFYPWFYGFTHNLLQFVSGAIMRVPWIRQLFGVGQQAADTVVGDGKTQS